MCMGNISIHIGEGIFRTDKRLQRRSYQRIREHFRGEMSDNFSEIHRYRKTDEFVLAVIIPSLSSAAFWSLPMLSVEHRKYQRSPKGSLG